MITWIFKSVYFFCLNQKLKQYSMQATFPKKIYNYFPNQIMYKKNFRTEMFILQLDIRACKNKYIRFEYT